MTFIEVSSFRYFIIHLVKPYPIMDAKYVIIVLFIVFDIVTTQVVKETSIIVCENFQKVIKCPGKQIKINYAFFGRANEVACSNSTSNSASCTTNGVFAKVLSICYGKESCELTAKTSVFGDQCHKTSKYLQVDYQCEAIPKSLIICGGYKHSLRCPRQQIEIVRAFYGRSNAVICSDGHSQSVSCSAKGVKQNLEGVCQGKDSCDVTADANIFGDPCSGTSKYLSVDYKCIDLPVEEVLICEGFTKNIRCQDGQHLYIHRAFYGRSNSVTCSDSRAQQISCSMPDVFSAISHWCNGERECTLAASNRTFGDPCPQTSKYLSLQYSCQDDKNMKNACTPSKCKHGGTCINDAKSSRCACKTGYTGSFCQTDINECEPSPCMHGGRCIDGVGSYSCTCLPGFTGVRCEKDVNECECSPCMNGGTCIDGINSYSCRCTSDFTGVRCEKGSPGIGHGISNNNINAIKNLRKEVDKGGKRITLCQGSKKIFGCPNSTRISITDAKYGRTTTHTCPDTPRKASSCETDITKEMANISNNQQTCNGEVFQQQWSAAANNACLGTIPYVTLTYVCK
ncbi:neurogenic locus notch homolog protein 1-like [Mytilus trossulus]|uniref:neurogenic locus notch homolog protein 1-like n=1 Tax=Mytilus trossulus TaxID=6551 RepID=UPI003005C184